MPHEAVIPLFGFLSGLLACQVLACIALLWERYGPALAAALGLAVLGVTQLTFFGVLLPQQVDIQLTRGTLSAMAAVSAATVAVFLVALGLDRLRSR